MVRLNELFDGSKNKNEIKKPQQLVEIEKLILENIKPRFEELSKSVESEIYYVSTPDSGEPKITKKYTTNQPLIILDTVHEKEEELSPDVIKELISDEKFFSNKRTGSLWGINCEGEIKKGEFGFTTIPNNDKITNIINGIDETIDSINYIICRGLHAKVITEKELCENADWIIAKIKELAPTSVIEEKLRAMKMAKTGTI